MGIATGILLLLSVARLVVNLVVIALFNLDAEKNPQGILEGLISGAFFIILSIFLNFTANWFRTQHIKTELEKKQLESELNMLKYQVNPHFLFNTLNNIYSLVRKKSDEAPEALLRLSNLMRYMIYDTQTNRVLLTKEVEYLGNFIELQKMRMKNSEIVQFTVSGDLSNQLIAPMILIPFVENAFKHSPRNSQDPIYISIHLVASQLRFCVENMIKSQSDPDKTSGIGLENVKKRLNLDYPKSYVLTINSENRKFSVELILYLTK